MNKKNKKCEQCEEDSFEYDLKYMDWSTLFSFIECLRLQGHITDSTSEYMTNKLMRLKLQEEYEDR